MEAILQIGHNGRAFIPNREQINCYYGRETVCTPLNPTWKLYPSSFSRTPILSSSSSSSDGDLIDSSVLLLLASLNKIIFNHSTKKKKKKEDHLQSPFTYLFDDFDVAFVLSGALPV